MKLTYILLFSFIVLGFGVNDLSAQEKKLTSATSLQYIAPQSGLDSVYNFGIGVYASFDYKFNGFISGVFDIGWNDIEGDDYTTSSGFIQKHKLTVWEFTAGLKAYLGPVYAVARAGYFTGVHEFGFIPGLGLRLGNFDLQANYKLIGDNQWFGARVGWYWSR
jgi:hypothetical protein